MRDTPWRRSVGLLLALGTFAVVAGCSPSGELDPSLQGEYDTLDMRQNSGDPGAGDAV